MRSCKLCSGQNKGANLKQEKRSYQGRSGSEDIPKNGGRLKETKPEKFYLQRNKRKVEG